MKARNIIELLTILRYEVERDLYNGMCSIINCRVHRTSILFEYIFTNKEKDILNDYLEANNPTDTTWYWWNPGEVAPRLDWIDKQLNKLQSI